MESYTYREFDALAKERTKEMTTSERIIFTIGAAWWFEISNYKLPNNLTPEEQAQEYLSEFSKEKSIDIAETMKYYAEEFYTPEWVYFWDKVISILKK